MKNKTILLSVFILGLFLAAGCSQQSTTDKPIEDVELTGEFKTFEIVAKQWEFIPDTIEVNVGDEVEIHIESVDVEHGFTLFEFGINERLQPGQDVHVNFVADKKGTFLFACSVPCGRGHGGMKGQLIVK